MSKYIRDPFWTRTLELIKAHKVSRAKFAAYIGVSYDTFRNWVYRNRIPIAHDACNIADALGVSVEYLVRGKDGLGIALTMKQVEKRKKLTATLKKLIIKLNKTGEELN